MNYDLTAVESCTVMLRHSHGLGLQAGINCKREIACIAVDAAGSSGQWARATVHADAITPRDPDGRPTLHQMFDRSAAILDEAQAASGSALVFHGGDVLSALGSLHGHKLYYLAAQFNPEAQFAENCALEALKDAAY